MQHRSFALFGFDLASCLALETSQKNKTKNKKQNKSPGYSNQVGFWLSFSCSSTFFFFFTFIFIFTFYFIFIWIREVQRQEQHLLQLRCHLEKTRKGPVDAHIHRPDFDGPFRLGFFIDIISFYLRVYSIFLWADQTMWNDHTSHPFPLLLSTHISTNNQLVQTSQVPVWLSAIESPVESALPVRALLMRLFTQYTLVKSDTSCNPFLLYSSIMWSVI